MAEWHSGWRAAADQALGLLLGSQCVVCAAPGAAVCEPCAPQPVVQRRRLNDGLLCLSGGEFDAHTAPLMTALKQDGVTRVARDLAPLLRAAYEAVSTPSARAVLVPVPTRAAADRRRGYRPVEVLMRAAHLPLYRALRVATAVRDQRELSRDERARNTLGAFAVRRTVAMSAPVIVVDDVVTTGATLTNCARTLTSAGFSVAACITVLSTPKRVT